MTISGNGQLSPSSVVEAEEAPRRLLLDFPEVSAKTPNQIGVDSEFLKKVRVGVNSRDPLVTRVVMEIVADATYHVERAGPAGRDLAVVFEAPAAASDRVLLPAVDDAPQGAEPEPPISMAQAMQNVASITPATDRQGPEPIMALQKGGEVSVVAKGPLAAGAAPNTPAAKASAPAATRKPAARQQPAPQPPPAPAPAFQQDLPTGADTQKKFTGHPVSLDFQGADLRAVLRGFSEISGLNMVIDPDVQGTVDIILNEVPWDQALDVILRGNQLDYTVDGTIVRIARLETLRKEQDSRQALAKSAADAGTLAVRTFSLSYARGIRGGAAHQEGRAVAAG